MEKMGLQPGVQSPYSAHWRSFRTVISQKSVPPPASNPDKDAFAFLCTEIM